MAKARKTTRYITIDVDDVDDEAPAFSQTSIAAPIKASRKVDAKTKAGTTSLTVNQEQNDKLVVVVQLSEVWSDVDSDEDDLDFDLGGRSGLPDWVTVYGPDDWEDIHERRSAVGESDAPSGTRDGDQVIVIVIDRTSGEDGDNEGVGTALASFTLTATDDEGNSTTETISINVSDTNVPITVDDDDPVVAITGTASGLGHVNMAFGADQDPDLDEPGDAVLVLYTWSTIARDDPETMDVDESVPVAVMVSTSPQPLALDATDADGTGPPDMMNDYLGMKIMASVEYYEVDPVTGEIAKSESFSAVTEDYIKAPAPGEGEPASVSFDFTTDDHWTGRWGNSRQCRGSRSHA